MEYVQLNAYKLTHENSEQETINASNISDAIANAQKTDTPIVHALRVANNVMTLVKEVPDVSNVYVVVSDGRSSALPPVNFGYPSLAEVHAGDNITLQAVSGEHYEFIGWFDEDDVEVSSLPNFVLTAKAGTNTYTAKFQKSDVSWKTAVSPSEAEEAGCLAFPTATGSVPEGTDVEMFASEKGDYTFDHWELRGESISTTALTEQEIPALTSGETELVYTAVFTSQTE